MKDRDLDQLLRDLPREGASVGFKTRVLARSQALAHVDDAGRPRWATSLRWSVVAAAALAIVFATVSWREAAEERREEIARHAAEAPEDRTDSLRIETMRNEYRDLEQEMRHLRRLVAASEPLVGVQGNGEYDYVFDLQQITRARGGDAFPVSYRLPE